MQLTELLLIKKAIEKQGITPQEYETLVNIWTKMHKGLAYKSVHEVLSTVLYASYVRANENMCKSDDDKEKVAACILLKARMIVNQQQQLEIPNAFNVGS